MREVLFSSNQYISNIVDGIQIITKSSCKLDKKFY
jgi:hypothetical protein